MKETPCAPVAPNDKPSPVAPTRVPSTTNQQVCGCKHAWTRVDFEKSHRKDILNWNLHVPVQLAVFHHFRQTPLDPRFDFRHLITRCPSCYPKIGGWADPQWGGPQACEEDLHRRWQRCNSPPIRIFVWFGPARLYRSFGQLESNASLSVQREMRKKLPSIAQSGLTVSRAPLPGASCVAAARHIYEKCILQP